MAAQADKIILDCSTCGQQVRIPGDRRKLQVTCPKCRTSWLWQADSRTSAGRLEVRPRNTRNAVIVGVLCLAFTAVGIAIVMSGENIRAGLLAVAFFGGGGLYGIRRMSRRPVTMVLSEAGLQQCYPEGNTTIPWEDIEQVGICRVSGTRMVGIRLRTYDRFLDNVSPAQADYMLRALKFMKLMARGATTVSVEGGVGLWIKAQQRPLKSFGKVGSVADCLMWSRQTCGYDIGISWAELDRPAETFVELLESYRRQVLSGRSSAFRPA